MKIIELHNDHLKYLLEHYKCKCPNCGTIFSFLGNETESYQYYNKKFYSSYVKCPNTDCGHKIEMSNPAVYKMD